jgi:hypothetical protein
MIIRFDFTNIVACHAKSLLFCTVFLVINDPIDRLHLNQLVQEFRTDFSQSLFMKIHNIYHVTSVS